MSINFNGKQFCGNNPDLFFKGNPSKGTILFNS